MIERGLVDYDQGRNLEAIAWYRQALAAEASTDNRDDGEAQILWGNLGTALLNLGRYDEAQAALKQAAELARRTYGEGHADYWAPAANHARLLHLNGQREAALREFDALRRVMPDAAVNHDAWGAIATYADCLLAQGDAAAALPLLEGNERFQQAKSAKINSLRRNHLRLGEAYDQLGRVDERASRARRGVCGIQRQRASRAAKRAWRRPNAGRAFS